MQIDQSILNKDRQDFEVNLRKKKRLVAYEHFREYTKFNISEDFRKSIMNKKDSWKAFKILNYGDFIDSARNRIAKVEEKLEMNLCLEDFFELLFLCQELCIGIERMIGEECEEIMRRISSICKRRKEFAFVVKISDLKGEILKILCQEELKAEDFTFFSHFFGSVIENCDLSYWGKLNTASIINEKIKNRELINDSDIAFMTKAIENNEEVLSEYFLNYYLRDNSDQFDQNLLSADHFSLILCSVATVDLEAIHESCKFFILDNFEKVLKSSSDLATFNSLLGLERLVETNTKAHIEIVYHEVIFSILNKLHHPSELISDQSSSLILHLVQKDNNIIIELLQRNLIQELSVKLTSNKFSQLLLDNTIHLLESSISIITSTVPYNIKSNFSAILHQSTQSITTKYSQALKLIISSLIA